MKLDAFGRAVIGASDLVDTLLAGNQVGEIFTTEAEAKTYNQARQVNYSDLPEVTEPPKLDVTPEEWHRQNQQTWLMPKEYAEMDIARWVLQSCDEEAELQRCATELLEFDRRGQLPLLCYLKYLVDTLRENQVVWGLGRGSSTASYVLYKIGVHKVDSLYYDLPFDEFMR